VSEIQNTLITIALRGITVLPRMRIYLDMSRPMSIAAATNAQKTNQNVFLVAQKDPSVENPGQEQLETYGVIAQVKQIIKGPDNGFRVLVTSLQSARLEAIEEYVPNLMARVTIFQADEEDDDALGSQGNNGEAEHELEQAQKEQQKELEDEAKIRVLKDLIEQYCHVQPKASRELANLLLQHMDLGSFCALVACNVPMKQQDRQNYLAVYPNEDERYEFLLNWLNNETLVERFRMEYQGKVKTALDKQQRDYILREQMRLIRKELGEGAESAADRYEKQLAKLKAPDEVKKQLEKEIKRLRSNPMDGSESKVSQNYIETLLEMPWEERTEEHISIRAAREELDKDHYGLEKVKEQVLEFLAVRQLQMHEQKQQMTEENQTDEAQNGKSQDERSQAKQQPRKGGRILCLVGPPGTGKTSIARSIASALNRKYVRISLGGVHDEAEIRGHRRTYVAAMPGRIAQAIKKAGVINPLMLLDELDKMGSDSLHGDVSSAMLEVLDPEQNATFTDHYLEVPLDLSDVLFVATANTLQTIPQPLLDRMEVIEVSSYTEKEKYQIAERFLLPKQIKEAALPEGLLCVTKEALEKVIRGYTREAGVRNLERQLAILCRKAALEYLEENKEHIEVTADNLSDYLGRERFHKEEIAAKGEPGLVRGLAWTSVGGVTLEVEVNVTPGKGAMKLTGKLGDVMKESAQAALSCVQSVAGEYGVEYSWFEQHDIHIHIPEGAVPKDGPSAGITMAIAILSAVLKRAVRPDVAMTGEITLRGRVLAIGGLKEKLLAAKAAGVKLVFVPADNRADYEELTGEVTEGLCVRFVTHMREVVKEVFEA
jgi:ATP-dependent Lon protease